jgi:hypothetical protein
MKICPLGAELFHADRRTDMTLIGVFRNSANAPKSAFYRPEKEIYTHFIHPPVTGSPQISFTINTHKVYSSKQMTYAARAVATSTGPSPDKRLIKTGTR